jgi:flagellar protein FlaJ
MLEKTLDSIHELLSAAGMEVDPAEFSVKILLVAVAFGMVIGFALPIGDAGMQAAAVFLSVFIFIASLYGLLVVTAAQRISLVEDILPDFLSIMASNIRSGMTYDRALLLSSRKEFGPLGREIDRTAKEALAGKPMTEALMGMSDRIRSETFSKTVRLIVEGIKSGGNLADLLENTASDIRRFGAIRKEVSATVLVYQLFMLAAAAIGAPMLYAVTTLLVQTTSQLRGKMDVSADVASNLPFFSQSAQISSESVFLYSIAALAITGVFGSLAAGVVSKGKESDGYPYVPIVMVAAYCIFFVGRAIMESVFAAMFSA